MKTRLGARRVIRNVLFLGLPSLLIGGCVTITQPTQGSVVSNPVAAAVTVKLPQYCDSFKVTLDGADVTGQFSPLPPGGTPSQANFASLAGGNHTLAASANTLQYWVLIPYCGADGDSATFTVPVTVGAPPPGSPNCFPFGGNFSGASSGRYQQLYSASAFPGPITITALKFFDTQAPVLGGATSLPSGSWAIALSTTSATLNTLSANFAANVGSNNTPVFSGNLTQPWALGDTLTIPLSTPFTYVPANGNLLMDVTVSNLTPTSCFIYFDATGSSDLPSTVTGHVDSDGVFNGYGLVTGFY